MTRRTSVLPEPTNPDYDSRSLLPVVRSGALAGFTIPGAGMPSRSAK